MCSFVVIHTSSVLQTLETFGGPAGKVTIPAELLLFPSFSHLRLWCFSITWSNLIEKIFLIFFIRFQKGRRFPAHHERWEAPQDPARAAGPAGLTAGVRLHRQRPHQWGHQHVLHAPLQGPDTSLRLLQRWHHQPARKILWHEQEAVPGRLGLIQEVLDQNGPRWRVLEGKICG